MAGFGYDAGIYRYHILGYFFENAGVPFGFSNFSNWLMLLGDNVDYILFVWYLVLSLFVLLGVYLLSKNYFFSRLTGVFAVLLFSSSIIQFEFFWWYYYRQFLASFFILLVFLFIKRRWYLVVPVLIVIGVVHPLSLIPIGLSLLIYLFFVDKNIRKFLLFYISFARFWWE